MERRSASLLCRRPGPRLRPVRRTLITRADQNYSYNTGEDNLSKVLLNHQRSNELTASPLCRPPGPRLRPARKTRNSRASAPRSSLSRPPRGSGWQSPRRRCWARSRAAPRCRWAGPGWSRRSRCGRETSGSPQTCAKRGSSNE